MIILRVRASEQAMDQPIFLWSKCIHALESIYLRVKHMFVVSKSTRPIMPVAPCLKHVTGLGQY